MKKGLLLLVLLPILSFASTGISEIENSQGKWDIYYTTPSGKRFFIYEDTGHISTTSSPSEDLIYNTNNNIFWILFTCQKFGFTCARYVNLSTNQISNTFTNVAPIIDKDQNTIGALQNLNQKVVVLFNYPNDFSFTITPIFEDCANPFEYKLKHLSIGPDIGSRFLSNGNLYLNIGYEMFPDKGTNISIDYKKLYQDCQAHS